MATTTPNAPVVIAGIAGATILLAATRSLFVGTSSAKHVEDDLSESDCIGPDDVIGVFDALFMQMQGVLAQLSQQIQQIQQSGQTIPEAQLRGILKTEFERALVAKQEMVFEDADMDEDCLEEATWEFMAEPDKYPKVKKSVERFQKLYENVTGESVVGRRPGDSANSTTSIATKTEIMSQEKLLGAAETYFDALTAAMAGIVNEYKAEGKDLRDPSVAQGLHMKFASVANDAGEEALQNMGISLDDFRASIETHSSNPEVGRMLSMLQMKQQQELMAMGVPAM